MDLAAHFAAMWRHRWVVLLASVVVAVLTFGVVSLQPKVYQAQAQLSITPGQVASSGQGEANVVPFLAQTYEALAKTTPVLDDAVRRSGLGLSETTANERLSVQNPGGLGFLELYATGPDPNDALALAKGFSEALVAGVAQQQQQAEQQVLQPLESQASALANQLAQTSDTAQRTALEAQYQAIEQSIASTEAAQPNEIDIVSPAQGSSSPVAPKPKRDGLLAFVTALVVLAEMSVGYEVIADRFGGTAGDEEIRRLVDLPVLARIPPMDGPELVEAFRSLRTSLLFVNGGGASGNGAPANGSKAAAKSSGSKTVAIVSSSPQVGKSFVSMHLASSFADLGVYVALVDGDMRRPSIAGRMGVPNTPGLSEALNGGGVAEMLNPRRTESGFPVYVLPAGSAAPDPAALLTGRLSEWVFPSLSGFDEVVVDTPAQNIFPDAAVIAARCDATVLVIDANSTKRRSLKALVEDLRQIGAHPVGVVVNRHADGSAVGRATRYYSRTGYYSRSAEAASTQGR